MGMLLRTASAGIDAERDIAAWLIPLLPTTDPTPMVLYHAIASCVCERGHIMFVVIICCVR